MSRNRIRLPILSCILVPQEVIEEYLLGSVPEKFTGLNIQAEDISYCPTSMFVAEFSCRSVYFRGVYWLPIQNFGGYILFIGLFVLLKWRSENDQSLANQVC